MGAACPSSRDGCVAGRQSRYTTYIHVILVRVACGSYIHIIHIENDMRQRPTKHARQKNAWCGEVSCSGIWEPHCQPRVHCIVDSLKGQIRLYHMLEPRADFKTEWQASRIGPEGDHDLRRKFMCIHEEATHHVKSCDMPAMKWGWQGGCVDKGAASMISHAEPACHL